MGLSKITALALSLLMAALPTTSANGSSLHYKLHARVTGPKTDSTPKVDGWALEVQRLGITTRIPADWMWGVLINPDFNTSRGGDVFYTQQQQADTSKMHVRTDAPNVAGEVTPFGFYVQDGSASFPLVSDQMVAVRSNTAETETDIGVDGAGVPFLEKPAFQDGTFVACDEVYREWAVVYWLDAGKYGTDPIYKDAGDWRNCTEIQLVPECSAEGPEYDGQQETPCVADIGTVL